MSSVRPVSQKPPPPPPTTTTTTSLSTASAPRVATSARASARSASMPPSSRGFRPMTPADGAAADPITDTSAIRPHTSEVHTRTSEVRTATAPARVRDTARRIAQSVAAVVTRIPTPTPALTLTLRGIIPATGTKCRGTSRCSTRRRLGSRLLCVTGIRTTPRVVLRHSGRSTHRRARRLVPARRLPRPRPSSARRRPRREGIRAAILPWAT